MAYILSIDQGTTSTRCLLVDSQGNIVCSAQQEFKQYFPHPGYVQHDSLEILESVISTLKNCLKNSGISVQDIKGIGIANQRETTVVWDKHTGKPVHQAIVWQSRQSEYIVEQWKQEIGSEILHHKTGLVPDAYFSASKIAWILEHVPQAKEQAIRGDLLFGTIDTWLVWNLTKERRHVTEITNASRTMLFNLHQQQWDEALCDSMQIPLVMLPEVLDCCDFFGTLKPEILGYEIPILGIAGDQQAALFGQVCSKPGMIKNTYGTGCFMLMNTGNIPVLSSNGLLTTVAWRINGKITYALEGSVFVAGSGIQWLRDQLGILNKASDAETIAASVEHSGGVVFVPAFVGLGAPYWDQHARGAFFGLTRGTQKAHMIRAALEAMAFQTRDVMELMQEEAKIEIQEIRVDGGAAANNLLMQFQSDQLQAKVIRPKVIESTALGAAFLAGIQAGVWSDLDELTQLRIPDKTFDPQDNQAEMLKLYEVWKKAVKACLSFQ